MADPKHLYILDQGVEVWNRWRDEELQTIRDGADFNGEIPEEPYGPNLVGADLSGRNLSGVNFHRAGLQLANLSGANLSSADLSEANLRGTLLLKTDLSDAILTDCAIWGVAAWGVKLDGAEQKNLKIVHGNGPMITVDNLQVAQFIYLLLNNKNIRDVIQTVGQKAVLILGRFTPERKGILDAIADRLRQMGFLPIIFDFEKSQARDFTETIKTLAGLSAFVIADLTNPRSNPLELQATVPDYEIPFVPLIQDGEEPFSMFIDLQRKYKWVLPVITYDTREQLMAGFEKAVIEPALLKRDEIIQSKEEPLKKVHMREILHIQKLGS